MTKFQFYSKKISLGTAYFLIKAIQYILSFGGFGFSAYFLYRSITTSINKDVSFWALISPKNSSILFYIIGGIIISIASIVIFKFLSPKIDIIKEKISISYSFYSIKAYMRGDNQNASNSFSISDDSQEKTDYYEEYSMQFEPEESGITKGELDSYKKFGSDDPEGDLNKLIGLENVKRQVRIMNARMQDESGTRLKNSSGNHMCFLGPAGTGKTTVARIMTGILYKCGYIKKNICIEINGQTLKGSFMGQTGKRTQTIVDSAKGGVLFIDEAYILCSGANDSYGDEAIGVLLQAMENNRNDFVVILAGYDDEIDALLEKNPGFTSRIKHKIRFDNYTNEEMSNIFKFYTKENGFSINDDAFAELGNFLCIPPVVLGRHFGNIRYVRTFLDKVVDCHYDNYGQGLIEEEDRKTICLKDIKAASEIEMEEFFKKNPTTNNPDVLVDLIKMRLSIKGFVLSDDAAILLNDFIERNTAIRAYKLSFAATIADKLIASQIRENERNQDVGNHQISRTTMNVFLDAQL